MKIKRAISLTGFSLCIATTAVQMGGCSAVPKPAEADGSSRVPANDTARVQALQQRVNTDRKLLLDNSLLRAQVDVLQTKLNEMTTIVREALTLPAAPRAQSAPIPVPTPPVAAPQSMAIPNLPAYAYATNPSGVVVRVFHSFARTEFEPSEQVAQALRTSVRGAEQIEVSGHTDSNAVNPIDKLVAIERAEKARTWLINNGAEASKIRTKYFTAGNFLVENRTPQGRSVNRRVEIGIRNQQLAGHGVAAGN
ncbi:MAG: OmpA family protein [Ramlibacter sp.]|nr:OmpA family protein [Ramlibacter sp.]